MFIALYYRTGFFNNSGNSIYVPLRNATTPANTTICKNTFDNQLIKKLIKRWPLSDSPNMGKRTPLQKKPIWCRFADRMLQSIELVITNSTVPLHNLVEGQVTGLATSHPCLNLNFFSTWFLTLFKRMKLPSIMDGFQNRETCQLSLKI